MPYEQELTVQVQVSEPLQDINIAVVGAEGVGKSTLIQKALELPNLPASLASERRISARGSDYHVRLLELPIEDIDVDDDDNTVNWPETIEDKIMPRIDGALVLYDVKDPASLEHVPEMLSECLHAHNRRCSLTTLPFPYNHFP